MLSISLALLMILLAGALIVSLRPYWSNQTEQLSKGSRMRIVGLAILFCLLTVFSAIVR